jgi:mRNA interferase MazF
MNAKEIHRGEIYFVDLNPTQGREQAGQRPVLVLSIDAINKLPLVVTVVVGTKGANVTRDYPTNIRISPNESGLPIETVFMGFQIRSLDPSRFPAAPAGKISEAVLEKVEDVVRYCLGL